MSLLTADALSEKCRNLRVLYVEDEPEVRNSFSELLRFYFDQVDIATNGREGIEKYQKYYEETGVHYDIVFTDIRMPEMDGIALIEAIQSLHERQLVVVTSAYNDSKYLLHLIDLEVAHYIVKPITVERFHRVLGRVVAIIDAKERFRRMNEELYRAKLEAERSAAQTSQFLANMSHEIRTPLNAITGFISLLDKEERDPQKRKYLHVIRSASDSLLQIINDILDISKIESGKLEIEPVDFNPYDDLIMVAELFQAKAAEKDVDFRIKYNSSMPASLRGDVLLLKQIIANLLSNAIKFTPGGSVVKYIIWYKSGKLNIRVKDYGIGIAEEKQATIFESFAQADISTAREYGGTGLGLAISKKLADRLGGTLILTSREGVGSSFHLSVAMPLSKKRESSPSTPELQPSLDLLHLLLVEDNETNRMLAGIILENAGMTYDVAVNGFEAIEKFKSGHYGLILMDENMPKLDGVSATREIRKIEKQRHLPHTPIVALTANALKGDKERLLKSGMDNYITKPIEPEKLLQAIGETLSVLEEKQERV